MLHALEEIELVQRLHEVVVRAELAPAHRVAIAAEARHHHHRKRLGALIRPDAPQELEAVDLRQHHIEQHERRQRIVGEELERRLAVGRVLHRVALALEPAGAQIHQVFVVLDDEDAVHDRPL